MNGLFREGSLGSILFRSGIITEADIGAALQEQKVTGCRFGEALVALGIVTQEDIDWALSSQLDIPYVRLKKEMLDPEAVALVPAEVARRHGVVPILRVGDELTLALADPLDRAAVEEVERLSGCKVTIAVALGREIREMLDRIYPEAQKEAVFSSSVLPAPLVAAINADPSGKSLTDHILRHAAGSGSASVSLWPQGDTVAVIARGAEATVIGTIDPEGYPVLVREIRRLAGCDPAVPSARGRLSVSSDGKEAAFDVSVVAAASGDFITFHRVCVAPFPGTLEGLGLPCAAMEILSSLLDGQKGALLVGGNAAAEFLGLVVEREARSGRGAVVGSERLVAARPGLLGLVARPEETPAMLAAVLEQGPDFIVVQEVAPTAAGELVRAAAAGIPVVAGIPAEGLSGGAALLAALVRSAPVAAEIVTGIVLLNRVPLLCADCRREVPPPPVAARHLPEGAVAFTASGCSRCGFSGRRGERYLADIVTLSEGLRAFLRSSPAPEQLLPRLREEANCLSLDEGRQLLASGDLSPEDFVSTLLL